MFQVGHINVHTYNIYAKIIQTFFHHKNIPHKPRTFGFFCKCSGFLDFSNWPRTGSNYQHAQIK